MLSNRLRFVLSKLRFVLSNLSNRLRFVLSRLRFVLSNLSNRLRFVVSNRIHKDPVYRSRNPRVWFSRVLVRPLSSTGIVIDLGLLGLLWVTKYCRRTGHNSLPSRCEWTRVDSLAF